MSRSRRYLLSLSVVAAFGAARIEAQQPGPVQVLPAANQPPAFVLPFDKTPPVFPMAAPATQVAHRVPKSSEVPLAELPEQLREKVREVIEEPTISGCGPVEGFTGRVEGYQWLLDHPDRVALGWIRLRTPCLMITSPSEGHFRWV